ncbi:hypothetical protein R3P38DRAFT_3415338 [Favolaschia claudopus]|uniref:C2H2-type domain-containing protein n=1 Tax=Favolaschia claudopus TaxID=2862362 RepID=A0AAW0EFP8_9AGAR
MSNNPSRVQSTTDATDTESGDNLQVAIKIALEKTDFTELYKFQKIAFNCVNEALDEVLSSDMQWDIRPGFMADAMKSLDHCQPPDFSTITSDEMVSNDEIAAVLGKYSPTVVEANITALMLPQVSTLGSSFPLSVPAPSLSPAARSSSVFSSRASTPQIQASSPNSGSISAPPTPSSILSVPTPRPMSRATSITASSRASTPRTQGWASRSGSMPPPRALSAAPSHSRLRQPNMASEPVVAVVTSLQLPRSASTSGTSLPSRSSSSTPRLGVPLPTIPSDSMWPQPALESIDEDASLWGEPEFEPMAVDEAGDFPPSLYPTVESPSEGPLPRLPFSFSNKPAAASDYNAVASSSRSTSVHSNRWNTASTMSEAELTAAAFAVGYTGESFRREYVFQTPNGVELVRFPPDWKPDFSLLDGSSRAPSTGPIRTQSRQQTPVTPYARPGQSSSPPNPFPDTAPIPLCSLLNQGLSAAAMFEQRKKAAWDDPAASVTCAWEGCSTVVERNGIWEHIKTTHKFVCRMLDRELRCGWVGSDGKQCPKKMNGSSMKKHVDTHAKPAVFIQCGCGVSLQERGLRKHYGL